MKTTRRNFLKGLIATTALPLLPSISFSKPLLDLPKDGYLFLMPGNKVYWVPEITGLILNTWSESQRARRPATQQTPLYIANAYFHCGTKTWEKFRNPENKTTLMNELVGYSAEEIKTKFLMPRSISHPTKRDWTKTERISEYQYFSVSVVEKL